jgi:hypothetical protein
MTVSYSQSVAFPCPANALLDQVAQILKEDWHARKIVRDTSEVRAKIGISFRSWGDVITVVATQQEGNLATVDITSMTALKTTLFDFGKSKNNVERLCSQLTERLAPPAG